MRIIGNDPSTPRQAQIVASGTLSTGDAVIVNADGTVSVVEETSGAGTPSVFEAAASSWQSAAFDSANNKVVIAYKDEGNLEYGTAVVGTVSGTSISFGTPVVFESAVTLQTATVFDSNAEKVVIAYRDAGNSSYGTAIVGTVSGTSISFGSPTVFESASSEYIAATFDSNSNKVVIAYRDSGNSSYGTAVVGTVSGTSISFGSPVVFQSDNSRDFGATFDSSNNKVVISYMNVANSFYGDAIVGTVSGTSISFGTKTTFNNTGFTFYNQIAFDSNANKVVIVYKDDDNSDQGTAIVGTVSGTSISFGTEVIFEAAKTEYPSVVFDSSANKIIVAYQDDGNSGYGTVISGTVSGTSITFDSPVVFEQADSEYTAAVYDSTSDKTVIAYRDNGNSSYGTAVVFSLPFTNLTAENYIGTAASGAADTQRVKINLKGAVDENQSGLTAGQSYYVQTDGTLGTTPADPSVFAGTAVAANKLIVKG